MPPKKAGQKKTGQKKAEPEIKAEKMGKEPEPVSEDENKREILSLLTERETKRQSAEHVKEDCKCVKCMECMKAFFTYNDALRRVTQYFCGHGNQKQCISAFSHAHEKGAVYVRKFNAQSGKRGITHFYGFLYTSSSTFEETSEILLNPDTDDEDDENYGSPYITVIPSILTFAGILKLKTSNGAIHMAAKAAMCYVFDKMRKNSNFATIHAFILGIVFS